MAVDTTKGEHVACKCFRAQSTNLTHNLITLLDACKEIKMLEHLATIHPDAPICYALGHCESLLARAGAGAGRHRAGP
jgi:hypothetical protein